jgi:hypothetical protein
VLPVTKATERMHRNQAPTERECPECLSDIPVLAVRCKFCTAVVQSQQYAPPAHQGHGFHRHPQNPSVPPSPGAGQPPIPHP